MDAKILLPVRPHIKKYLEIQFGKRMVVSSRGNIPLLIMLMLEKHAKKDPAAIRPSQKLIDGKEYVGYECYIGSAIFKSHGCYISHQNIKRFNDGVDDLMREHMVSWIHHPNATDHVVDFNIIRFRDFFDITEDELPFENLKRWYYRHLKRIQARKNSPPDDEPQLIISL